MTFYKWFEGVLGFFFRLWFGARWVCLNFVIQLIIIDYCRCVFLVTIKMYFLSVFIRLFLKHLTDVFFPDNTYLQSPKMFITPKQTMNTKVDSTVPPPNNNRQIDKQHVSRWWFHFFFQTLFREYSHFDSYFSDGLVQPPTSFFLSDG